MKRFMTGLILLLAGCGMSGSSKTTYLFLVQSQGAQLIKTDSGMQLLLTEVKPHVVVMADRPVRKAFLEDVNTFVNDWNKGGTDSFKTNPPNAAFLSADNATGQPTQLVIMEMSDPVLKGTTLSFTIKIIPDSSAPPILPEGQMMKEVTLFLDSGVPGWGG